MFGRPAPALVRSEKCHCGGEILPKSDPSRSKSLAPSESDGILDVWPATKEVAARRAEEETARMIVGREALSSNPGQRSRRARVIGVRIKGSNEKDRGPYMRRG